MINYPIDAIVRVIEKRRARGASDEQIILWLEDLKCGAWKGNINMENAIADFIDAIKQTPLR